MLLHYIYKIISLKLKGVSKKLTLQIAVKAINNFTSPDRLVCHEVRYKVLLLILNKL